jgi:hypothetical protein
LSKSKTSFEEVVSDKFGCNLSQSSKIPCTTLNINKMDEFNDCLFSFTLLQVVQNFVQELVNERRERRRNSMMNIPNYGQIRGTMEAAKMNDLWVKCGEFEAKFGQNW